MTIQGDFELIVEPGEENLDRLDAYLATRLSDCSRSFAAALIRQGLVRVDGVTQKPGYRVRPGQRISGCIPPPAPVDLLPEPITLDIVFQDADVIVVNKQPGLVVHPSAGHSSGTLVNGLLYHCPVLQGIGGENRPGIVHRLDKDTSGLLVVAKNDHAHQKLSAQFKQRSIKKIYWALVEGVPGHPRGCLVMPIGRHPTDRKKMSTHGPAGREACTIWCIKEYFPGSALLEIDLKTGRTHQVRVHCQAMGHPVVGDPVYGRRRSAVLAAASGGRSISLLKQAGRQMLHARQLTFCHPRSNATLTFEAPLPEDMQVLIERLRMLAADPKGSIAEVR